MRGWQIASPKGCSYMPSGGSPHSTPRRPSTYPALLSGGLSSHVAVSVRRTQRFATPMGQRRPRRDTRLQTYMNQ